MSCVANHESVYTGLHHSTFTPHCSTSRQSWRMALQFPLNKVQMCWSPDVMEGDGTPARFGFDESVFPGYSWRGYAAMSDLQV